MAMQRLLMNSREDGKTLVPCGVMAWREINGKSNWYFYPVNLPVNTEGELFAVDNGRRESMKVGDYTYHNMTLHWSFNGSSEFHKGYYVVFIKK